MDKISTVYFGEVTGMCLNTEKSDLVLRAGEGGFYVY
jgi:hypothetical protein